MGYVVSILVLMDRALGQIRDISLCIKTLEVSILVLMDRALGLDLVGLPEYRDQVSILVLMDRALGQYVFFGFPGVLSLFRPPLRAPSFTIRIY